MDSWTYHYPFSGRVLEGATKILKDGTIIFSEFRKKMLVFERCNCCRAGLGDTSLKLSLLEVMLKDTGNGSLSEGEANAF